MDFRTTFRPITVQPEQIEQKSFQIIDDEIGEHSFTNEQYAVVQRVIHASADFELGKSLLFHPRAIEAGVSAIRAGRKVGVSQDFVENIFSVHYGCCQSLVSEPFSGIDIVSAFGLSSLILK
ncbi:precorrin-8X methylmutase [Anoxybacillus thermarum]|uniref:Precorrin-8X methylmutase n=1 Tax=Anoxybacillus thermarum TaxID=404937 RepID=A0A0D0QC55_9BACL|nr:precorrin-8X methylmutase [Anoxybacillus thermarum]